MATSADPEKWTQAESDENADAIMKALFNEGTAKPPTPAKEDSETPEGKDDKTNPPEKTGEEVTDPAASAAPAPPPAPATPAATPASAPPTADEIATKVAEKITPATPKPEVAELTDEDKRNRDVFVFMAKENPKLHGDLPDKFNRFIAAERTYRETWEKANPGKTFDSEAEEHAEFYDANDPIQTKELQEAFDQSRIELIATRKAEEKLAESETKRLREEAIKTVSARLKEIPNQVRTGLAQAVDPALAKDLDKLGENDPAAELVLRQYTPMLEAMSAELEKAFTPGLNYPIDDEKNPVHKAIVLATASFEEELLKGKPEEQVLKDGRKLVSFEAWMKLTDAQKDQYWTIWIAPDKVREMLTREFAAKAKADLVRIRGKSTKSEGASATTTAPKPAAVALTATKKDDDADSFPNTTKGAESVASGDKDGAWDADVQKKIMAELFGS